MEYIDVKGLRLPKVGLGTFPIKGEGVAHTLDVALNEGYSLLDTAYKYKNETEIGEYLSKVHRNDVVVQSKFSATQLTTRKLLGIIPWGKKTVEDGLDGSLTRLQRRVMDIYLLHSPSPGYVKYYGELIKLRERGLVKVIGVCKFSKEQLEDIYQAYGEYPAINQIEVHPYHSNKRLIAFCQEKGIVVEARSVLTHGDALQEMITNPELLAISNEYCKTVPQVVIRWCIQQGMIAIVKAENGNHLKENIDVFDFSLMDAQMSAIDSLNQDRSFGFVSTLK